MKIARFLPWTIAFIMPFILKAQEIPLFNGIGFKLSLPEVQNAVNSSAAYTSLRLIDPPVFPLARKTEAHLIATAYKGDGYVLDEVVFTFADDQLVFIQAKGNVVDALAANVQDSVQTYIHYGLYPERGIFFDKADDSAWFLNEEGRHLNLFAWDHPLLPSNGGKMPDFDTGVEIPPYLEMGGMIESLEFGMEEASEFTHTEELDGSDPHAQVQVNCFGALYAGFPRKMEARFGDGRLNLVWILTGKGEEGRIREKLISYYGDPVFVNDDWEIFKDWQLGLRKDKPEIFIATPELGKFYKKEYFGQE